jgi:NAD(P)-dependent dehydrogenase (short-subunit alcohol dehydrogenase family)
MARLEGKVAIVTGASKGIGAGIARRLAADGARVVVNYAKSADAAGLLVSLIEKEGGHAVPIQADIARPEEITLLFEKTIAAFGRVDILVNNAGIYEFGDLAGITPDSIDRQFALNVKGLILATQAAAQAFPAEGDQGRGRQPDPVARAGTRAAQHPRRRRGARSHRHRRHRRHGRGGRSPVHRADPARSHRPAGRYRRRGLVRGVRGRALDHRRDPAGRRRAAPLRGAGTPRRSRSSLSRP